MIDYEKLSISEVRKLAEQGDPRAKLLAEELSPITILREISGEHWGRDIVLFIDDGDIEAGLRLSQKWYSKKALFHPNRWQKLQPFLTQRFDDGLTRFEVWNRNIVLPALALVMKDPKWDNVPLTKIHKIFRKEIRKTIEKDLLGGFTTDSSGYSCDDPGENDFEDQMENSTSELVDEIIGGFIENLIDLRYQLAKLKPDDREILIFSEAGDTAWLAKKFGISENVVSVRRNRLMKKLKAKIDM